MIKISFRNLESSELARQLVSQRVQGLEDKFPELRLHTISVNLSVENLPTHPGPDLFSVQLHIDGKKYGGIHIRKKSRSLYVALSELCESMLETLNRRGDKNRVVVRNRRRRSKHEFIDLVAIDSAAPIH